MSEVVLRIDGIKKLMSKLDEVQKDRVSRDALFEAGQYLVGWMQDKRLTGPRPKFLGVKSGLLRKSVKYSEPIKEGETWRETISTNTIYARIHEYGGIIRPKVKKFLRFKVLSSMRFMSKKGARLKNPVGNYKWIMTKKVTIPARPFMRPALEDRGNKERVVDILKEKVEEALEK